MRREFLDVREKREQLPQMTEEDLRALHSEVQEQLSGINCQLDEAKAFEAAGQAADPDWLARACIARRKIGLLNTSIQEEISKRKRAERRANQDSHDLGQAFVRAARMMLSEDQFSRILERASAFMGGTAGE